LKQQYTSNCSRTERHATR